MAKLISTDTLHNGFVERKHWFINHKFDLLVEGGNYWTDFYILNKKNNKQTFVELIQEISRKLDLYNDNEVRLLPKKDKCGISILNYRADEMFKQIENYLVDNFKSD